MEIDRLNKESERKDRIAAQIAAKTAAEMADQKAQIAAQNEKMEALQAVLVANGLLPNHSKQQTQTNQSYTRCTSAQARAGMSDLTPSGTPSRKRHLSQQPERAAKVTGSIIGNRFESLANANKHDQRDGLTQPLSAWRAGQAQQAQQAQSHVHHDQDAQRYQRGQLRGTFNVNNEKEMRQEIEIALESLNGEPFRGSLTRQEVKFQIYRECLGFTDFSNFDGVRFGHKGCPIVIIKFIEAINVDELFAVQFFDFRRKSSIQGRSHVDIIKCKIRGIRPPGGPSNTTPSLSQSEIDDGVRTIKIDGCDYRIPEETLVEFLSFFGTIVSEIMEDTFDDGIVTQNSGGNNRTGIYSVTIRLGRDIPQILPIMGRRIKVHYRGIQKLCPNCFGPHPKQVCQSRRILWRDYVVDFKKANPNIPEDLFGKWFGPNVSNTSANISYNAQEANSFREEANRTVSAIIDPVPSLDATQGAPQSAPLTPLAPTLKTLETVQPNQMQTTSKDVSNINKDEKNCEPRKSDFLVPETKAEEDSMIDKLIQAGSLLGEAEQIVASRKLAYNRACREFKKSAVKPSKWVAKSQKGKNRKSKQGSHVDPMDLDYEN